MLKIKTFTFNMFGVNTYIVWNPDTREAAIIDPGMINEDEQLALDRFIKNNNLTVKQLINTHMHVDHIFGDIYVKNKYGVDVKHAPTTHSSENVPQHNVACSACPKAYPW